MPIVTKSKIVFNRALTADCFHLQVHAPQLAGEVNPGQFVQVKVRPGVEPLLRTPLSVHDAQPERGTLELLYRVVGGSTRLLSHLSAGEQMDLLGPLGHGFSLPPAGAEAWLLAGGIGMAPLFYLARNLRQHGHAVRLLYGARAEADLVRMADLEQLGVTVEVCTDDGSCGYQGNVVQLCASREVSPGARIYACGPRPMLRAVDEFAARLGLPAELSLEEYMACGVGACLGCACATKDGGYAHVCTDGPVFPGGVLKI